MHPIWLNRTIETGIWFYIKMSTGAISKNKVHIDALVPRYSWDIYASGRFYIWCDWVVIHLLKSFFLTLLFFWAGIFHFEHVGARCQSAGSRGLSAVHNSEKVRIRQRDLWESGAWLIWQLRECLQDKARWTDSPTRWRQRDPRRHKADRPPKITSN